MSELLDTIPDVDIDDNGKFKYILIHVFDAENDTVKTIVRGYLREFHAHIYEEVEEKILKDMAPRLETECIGGGFIEHKAADKKIKVYGRSMITVKNFILPFVVGMINVTGYVQRYSKPVGFERFLVRIFICSEVGGEFGDF
ncbi:14 kDa phosphohistidine phosphatase-like isoform X1 [Neodiprion virginianus]|uniref:14 kDa phosphohistidine phosphatase-like isoform X1 n=1 Tax=Neodiprion virginianus TaxID=2961670 RepID=UPI001EE75CE0|nr:14 kDa phosphohistidine phosphatase-like isoform X1 [Neodiprion virginianus]XP_046615333.1 14 kDa phosphohistidine phosphatase-like isoform X1 [Neodiprion virginianus]XP_046615334.1 14 kDa phosphohistidine phosphatase-like isoform X1 [Neodiprion virginianus]XP_046615335.1 14 kDa phosphohistidine phosphatase-like isoform X1 [Neodiprion virginianus]XP_046615336.1 14 kDa phosphohistidine phosphatase-like isoform X1 [Neodiprion virginianus]